MTSIADLVTYQIPQTEADLQSTDGVASYSTIKTATIDRAKTEFYGAATVPAETTMNDLVKYFLSDISALLLIDVAIDWYQSRTVLSRSRDDVDNVRFYDRVASLRTKRREIQERIAAAKDFISAVAFGSDDPADVAGLPLTQATSEKRGKITKDPWQYGRFLYGDLIQISEGVEPVTIQVDRP